MDVGVLAVRYAKALYEYALENNVAEGVYALTRTVIGSFAASSSLSKTIEDPLLPSKDKLSLMKASAGLIAEENDSKADEKVSAVAESFFKLLIVNKRESYLCSAMRYYQLLYRKENNIGTARIKTAVPLEEPMEKRILQRASDILGKSIELEKVVDPKIVGGFILDVDDYRIDASVLSQVNRIKRKLLDKNRRIV